MADRKRGLGKGFGALIDPSRARSVTERKTQDAVFQIPVDQIVANPYQPRHKFDDESLKILADNIHQVGVLQPLAVRRSSDEGRFELIAGERRWRAAKLAGLREVPCVLIQADEENMGVLSLVENLLREDLNPLDEAEAYQQLIDGFDLTQERIAERVGRSRPHVANTLRLLGLPEAVRVYIAGGQLSAGHGRALAALDDADVMGLLARRIVEERLSVRETELLVKRVIAGQVKPGKKKTRTPSAHPYEELADELRVRLGTKVKLTGGKNKGKIEIHYFGEEELTRLFDLLAK
ncbi:MAG: ParB/RepB/Spo0J family partition protein [Candidatus Lernaella stagnicola]|nr:ParB/RepB/Spo0J family partition protein [Candidatus Lernaella stagnicola]